MRKLVPALLLPLLVACGSDDTSSDATPTPTPGGSAGSSQGGASQGGASQGGSSQAGMTAAGGAQGGSSQAGASQGGGAGAEAKGTTLLFDLEGSRTVGEKFFDHPFPSDARKTADGHIDVEVMPNPRKLQVFDTLRVAAGQKKGFSTLQVAYFRFDGPLAAQDIENVSGAKVDDSVLLVDIDPASDERGRLFPVQSYTPEEGDYTPSNVLSVGARPGFVLKPNRTYAYVVKRALGDVDGKPLGVGEAFGKALADDALYAPLRDTLAMKGVALGDVAAATVFTTEDVVTDLFELSTKVLGAYDVEIKDLAVDPDDGASHPRYCELHGKVLFPQFQRGTPPFSKEGLFEMGDDGLPKKQRDEEAPVVISLPKGPMPEKGYPLVMYFHGSGGLSTGSVDRGTWHPEDDPTKCPGERDKWNGVLGCNTKGEGPAHVVALRGLGMASSALPVNPERLPGADEIAYLNFGNLAAMRDTFRQGVIEQRLLIEALSKLEIPPDVVAACDGMSLPAGATAYRYDTSAIMTQGQSMGGMYTNMVTAVEPLARAAVPTGAGGYWGHFIFGTTFSGSLANPQQAFRLLLSTKDLLTFQHPGIELFEMAVEAVDPIVYMPRLSKRPVEGHAPRHVYEPVAKGDSYFASYTYDAVALAYGHQQAGEELWPEMQTTLALDGLGGLLSYPVAENLTSSTGGKYTGVVVQHEPDGVYDPHAIYSQVEAVKYQYGCFFDSWHKTGVGRVFAPAKADDACPSP